MNILLCIIYSHFWLAELKRLTFKKMWLNHDKPNWNDSYSQTKHFIIKQNSRFGVQYVQNKIWKFQKNRPRQSGAKFARNFQNMWKKKPRNWWSAYICTNKRFSLTHLTAVFFLQISKPYQNMKLGFTNYWNLNQCMQKGKIWQKRCVTCSATLIWQPTTHANKVKR